MRLVPRHAGCGRQRSTSSMTPKWRSTPSLNSNTQFEQVGEHEREAVARLMALRRYDDPGADGTRLPGCVKVYLPPPAGPFGMVFRIARARSGSALAFIAFGVRHPPHHANSPSVYRLADRRLHTSG